MKSRRAVLAMRRAWTLLAAAQLGLSLAGCAAAPEPRSAQRVSGAALNTEDPHAGHQRGEGDAPATAASHSHGSSDALRAGAPSECPCRAGASQGSAGSKSATSGKEFPLQAHELSWVENDPEWGPLPVVVWVPERVSAEQRLPVLIALHGRGESRKGPERGVRGWLDDYALGRTLQRLEAPPLQRTDFNGFVAPARLQEINARLQQQPYRPVILVMPYVPDVLKGVEAFENAERLAEIWVDRMLSRVRQDTPALSGAAHTGIDGVSLGGRASLLVGLSRSRAFRSVGALQAALDESELTTFARLARSALDANPDLELRLLTSYGDSFLEVNRKLQHRLKAQAVPSQLVVVHGNHSYDFNRGPGGYEMLLFHETALYEGLGASTVAQ